LVTETTLPASADDCKAADEIKLANIRTKFFFPPTTPYEQVIKYVKAWVVADAARPLFKGFVTLRLPPQYREVDFIWAMTVSDNVFLSFLPKSPEGADVDEWRRYPVQRDNTFKIDLNFCVYPQEGRVKLTWDKYLSAYCFCLCSIVDLS
jgi:hypothetical protein